MPNFALLYGKETDTAYLPNFALLYVKEKRPLHQSTPLYANFNHFKALYKRRWFCRKILLSVFSDAANFSKKRPKNSILFFNFDVIAIGTFTEVVIFVIVVIFFSKCNPIFGVDWVLTVGFSVFRISAVWFADGGEKEAYSGQGICRILRYFVEKHNCSNRLLCL